MAISKRKIEAIDLTGSDDENATQRQTSKKVNLPTDLRFNRPPLSSQSQRRKGETSFGKTHTWDRDNWAIPSTQADADAEIEGAEEYDDARYSRYELYGTLNTKIVGVRFYNGVANMGELVVVRREPSNPYDRNAIRIDNVQNIQIGHIGRQIAERIAPLMDDGSVLVEGVLTGEKGTFDMPIALKLFGSGSPVEQADLKARFKKLRLPLDHIERAEIKLSQGREREKQEMLRQKKEAALEKRRLLREAANQVASDNRAYINGSQPSSSSQHTTASQRGHGPGSQPSSQGFMYTAPSSQTAPIRQGPSLAEINSRSVDFNPRELAAVVSQFGASEDQLAKLPAAPQPLELKTQLLGHQLQGLQWLLDRESPMLPELGSNETVQLWKRRKFDYVNIATNFLDKKPVLASGGIMADDMGLGKTLQTISLILADPRRANQPTIIVAPLSVMSNWSQQCETHIKPEHALKILTYHGAKKNKSATREDFEKFDVIITNYETVAMEYMPAGVKSTAAPLPRPTGLFSALYRRVILDEAHCIRSAKTKKALAACALASLSQSRWALTGTPIVNNLFDLHSFVKFLGIAGGLELREIFNTAIVRPLQLGDERADVILQALIATICLRRMKDMEFVNLGLPAITHHKFTIEWAPHERERYETVRKEARGMLDTFTTRGQDASHGSGYSHLLEVLLRLRQVCNHWTLCRERVIRLMSQLEKNIQVQLTPENIEALQDLLQLNMDQAEDCPVCRDTLQTPVITTCGHSFCNDCISKVIETQHKCPMCRSPLADTNSLVQPKAELDASGSTPLSPTIDEANDPSSKIIALLDLLRASGQKQDGGKTIVFSQWTSFLDIIQCHLTRQGISFCRVDGKMKASARDDAIAALNTDPTCTVMLASLSVCSVGLNLCAANQVVLMDSWWAPAIEDQAVDRVYRLGQTRPVSVWRLVMDDSIEERVLDIQRKKRALVTTAFGAGRAVKKDVERATRLADMQALLR